MQTIFTPTPRHRPIAEQVGSHPWFAAFRAHMARRGVPIERANRPDWREFLEYMQAKTRDGRAAEVQDAEVRS